MVPLQLTRRDHSQSSEPSATVPEAAGGLGAREQSEPAGGGSEQRGRGSPGWGRGRGAPAGGGEASRDPSAAHSLLVCTLVPKEEFLLHQKMVNGAGSPPLHPSPRSIGDGDPPARLSPKAPAREARTDKSPTWCPRAETPGGTPPTHL